MMSLASPYQNWLSTQHISPLSRSLTSSSSNTPISLLQVGHTHIQTPTLLAPRTKMFKPLFEPRIQMPEQYHWVSPKKTKTPKRSSQPDNSKSEIKMASISKELKHILHILSQAWKFQSPPPPTPELKHTSVGPPSTSSSSELSSKKSTIGKELKQIAHMLSQAWKCQIPPPPSTAKESGVLQRSDKTETIKVQETKYQR
jgi:hypothetical protein